jgi:hypothetical protein
MVSSTFKTGLLPPLDLLDWLNGPDDIHSTMGETYECPCEQDRHSLDPEVEHTSVAWKV